MIGVTDRAKEVLKKLLTDNVDQPQACLRLTANEEGKIGLGIDVEMPGDQAVTHEGSNLLVVQSELAESLSGVAIDVEEAEEGNRLILVDKAE